MKTLFTTLILLFFASGVFAQDNVYFNKEDKNQYQIDFVRHCLKKYHDEKLIGYGFQLGGFIISGIGLSIDKKSDEVNGIYQNETGGWTYDTTVPNYGVHKADNSLRNVLIIGGAACSLSGIVFFIDSEKWMKRAYIGPDGFGVRFTF